MAQENINATFYIGKKNKLLFAAEAKPSAFKANAPDNIDEKKDYYPWGDDNNFPNNVIAEISDNPIINTNLHFRSCHIYAGKLQYGVVRGYERVGNEYVEIFEPLIVPAIEDWVGINNIPAYYFELLKDLLHWWHGAPVATLNKNRNFISRIGVVDWAHCRLSKQDSDGEIKYIFRSADWPDATEKTWKKYPLIDRYYDGVNKLKASKEKSDDFIYPLTIYSTGKVFYQDPAWMTILNTAWPSVSRKVAQFKNYFLAKQMGAMYVVKVPYGFWLWKYPDWEEKLELQEERRKTTINDLDEKITGVENTGKSLFLTHKPGSENEETTEFKIEPLSGNKMFDGVHIEDSQEAAANTFAALAFNQELIGSRPGKKSGGGSGSNIMQAGNTEVIANQIFTDFALEFLNFCFRFNGWKHDGLQIKWRKVNTLSTTLNTGGSTVETSSPTTTKVKQ